MGAIDLDFNAEPIFGPVLIDVATLRFRAEDSIDDGLDLVTLYHPVFDGTFDGNDTPIAENSITFGSASIGAVPEPGTIGVVLLAGLLLAQRRQRVF